MAITMRRGLLGYFDRKKLKPGELAITTDGGKLYYCYAAGKVKEVAAVEDLQNILDAQPEAYEALQELVRELEGNTASVSSILSQLGTLRTDVNGKVAKTDIVNNFTTTDTTKVPAAPLVKTLKESVDTLNGNLKYKIVNGLTSLGISYSDITSLQDLFVKLPNNVILIFAADDSFRIILGLPTVGTIYIFKQSDSRSYANYYTIDGRAFWATNHSSKVSGWHEISSKSDLGNYISKSGGTLSGDIILDRGTTIARYIACRTVDNIKYSATLSVGANKMAAIQLSDVTNSTSLAVLYIDGTQVVHRRGSTNYTLATKSDLDGARLQSFTDKVSDMLTSKFCTITFNDSASNHNAPPLTEGGNGAWWNVITWGIVNRCCQIAVYGYNYTKTDVVYFRRQHDNNVSDWIRLVTNADLVNYIPTKSNRHIDQMWMDWDATENTYVLKVQWTADGTTLTSQFVQDK